jgi:4-hydroxyphenylpyruvate dioxygenase
MEIAYIHFYVEDIGRSRNWFIETMGFSFLGQSINTHTITEYLGINSILFLLSAPLRETSPVASYLKKHPPGVADIAFKIKDFDLFSKKLVDLEIEILENDLISLENLRTIKIKGWGNLEHTLIESQENTNNNLLFSEIIPKKPSHELKSIFKNKTSSSNNSISNLKSNITGIDHVVLNVQRSHLKSAVTWYQRIFDFQVQQLFTIKTPNSGLYSEALIDPSHKIQFNINEPTSANSQIQEFLDLNVGSGIQHIALKTRDILQTVQQMRNLGLTFLEVPPSYYQKLDQKYRLKIQSFFNSEQWQQFKKEQILLDFSAKNPQSLLMQIFSQPIFEKPTFFFEFIERRDNAEGFGEGNFLALFEAMETEQRERNLK